MTFSDEDIKYLTYLDLDFRQGISILQDDVPKISQHWLLSEHQMEGTSRWVFVFLFPRVASYLAEFIAFIEVE